MSNPRLPLLELFVRLRGLGLPLGLGEYVAALRAAAVQVGVASRAELTWVCQCLWAHSVEEQQQVALAIEATLPARLTEAEMQRMLEPSEAGEVFSAGETHSEAQQEGSVRGVGGETSGAFPVVVGGAPEGKAVDMPRPELKETGHRAFDLAGVPRVPPRAMHRAWRRLRNMQRTGPATDLDVSATAVQLARNGVLTAPILLPRRANKAGVVVLLDEGGSMVPFRRLVAALLHAVRHSGLARADVFSFHDVPDDTLFREPGLREPVPLDKILKTLDDSSLLVVSDAGAARGRLDQERVEHTQVFLDRARACSPRLAWLNPVPRKRWLRTTAAAIARLGVPMQTLDRVGLESAIDALRGREP